MSDDKAGGLGIRLQVTANRKKAQRQYEELMRSGSVQSAVVIAELKNGQGYHVLGQGLGLEEVARALMVAAHGVSHAAERQDTPRAGQTFGVSDGLEVGRAGPAIRGEVVKREDGTLVPPAGETWMTCGECSSSSWYITGGDRGVARFVCTRCSNEVKLRHDILHGPGVA